MESLPSDVFQKVLSLTAGSNAVLLLGFTFVCRRFRDEARQVEPPTQPHQATLGQQLL